MEVKRIQIEKPSMSIEALLALDNEALLQALNIPNVTWESVQGKRSRVFDRETGRLSEAYFMDSVRKRIQKYGIPVYFYTYDLFIPRDPSSFSGEREWDETKGTGVYINFECHNDSFNMVDYFCGD